MFLINSAKIPKCSELCFSLLSKKAHKIFFFPVILSPFFGNKEHVCKTKSQKNGPIEKEETAPLKPSAFVYIIHQILPPSYRLTKDFWTFLLILSSHQCQLKVVLSILLEHESVLPHLSPLVWICRCLIYCWTCSKFTYLNTFTMLLHSLYSLKEKAFKTNCPQFIQFKPKRENVVVCMNLSLTISFDLWAQ